MPSAAVERVVAGRAVQHVGAGIAGDHVVQGVAGAVDVAGAEQRQVLDRARHAAVLARLKLIDDWTVSMPFEPARLSLTMSAALSTT